MKNSAVVTKEAISSTVINIKNSSSLSVITPAERQKCWSNKIDCLPSRASSTIMNNIGVRTIEGSSISTEKDKNLINYSKIGLNSTLDANTVLLLDCEDLTDKSFYDKSVENNGASFSSSGKFEKGLVLSDGCVVVPQGTVDVDFSKDFTIDWWEYSTAGTSNSGIFTTRSTQPSKGTILLGYNGTLLYAGTSTASWSVFSGVTVKDKVNNVWVHWAFVKNGTKWSTYKNGNLFWTATSAGSIGEVDGGLTIGAFLHSTFTKGYNAIIDEFRVSNVARWTENFTPNTSPYAESIPNTDDNKKSEIKSSLLFALKGDKFLDISEYNRKIYFTNSLLSKNNCISIGAGGSIKTTIGNIIPENGLSIDMWIKCNGDSKNHENLLEVICGTKSMKIDSVYDKIHKSVLTLNDGAELISKAYFCKGKYNHLSVCIKNNDVKMLLNGQVIMNKSTDFAVEDSVTLVIGKNNNNGFIGEVKEVIVSNCVSHDFSFSIKNFIFNDYTPAEVNEPINNNEIVTIPVEEDNDSPAFLSNVVIQNRESASINNAINRSNFYDFKSNKKAVAVSVEQNIQNEFTSSSVLSINKSKNPSISFGNFKPATINVSLNMPITGGSSSGSSNNGDELKGFNYELQLLSYINMKLEFSNLSVIDVVGLPSGIIYKDGSIKGSPTVPGIYNAKILLSNNTFVFGNIKVSVLDRKL